MHVFSLSWRTRRRKVFYMLWFTKEIRYFSIKANIIRFDWWELGQKMKHYKLISRGYLLKTINSRFTFWRSAIGQFWDHGEYILSLLVEKVAGQLVDEAVTLSKVHNQVQWIEVELRRMQCFLKDADAKQESDSKVKNWVANIDRW